MLHAQLDFLFVFLVFSENGRTQLVQYSNVFLVGVELGLYLRWKGQCICLEGGRDGGREGGRDGGRDGGEG